MLSLMSVTALFFIIFSILGVEVYAGRLGYCQDPEYSDEPYDEALEKARTSPVALARFALVSLYFLFTDQSLLFFSMCLAYRRGWDVVFAEWDRGDFSRVRPTAPFPVGLLYYIIECQSIIGAGKKDLLGFSQMDGLRADAGSGRVEK